MLIGTEYRGYDWQATTGLDGLVSDAGFASLSHLISDTTWDQFAMTAVSGHIWAEQMVGVQEWIHYYKSDNDTSQLALESWKREMRNNYDQDALAILEAWLAYARAKGPRDVQHDDPEWKAGQAQLRDWMHSD